MPKQERKEDQTPDYLEAEGPKPKWILDHCRKCNHAHKVPVNQPFATPEWACPECGNQNSAV